MMRGAALLAAAAILAGCSSPGGKPKLLIPDKSINLTSTLKVPLSGVLALGAIYVVYDPLAPNWEIDESRLAEDTFRLSLRMKRYHTGGAGESMQVVRRRAEQLQRELGYGGYQLMEYSEGIDSQTLGARRVAEGMIRLVGRPAADSFLQN
ncbi:MAG: hypothetical protein H6R10_1413 [Rhodocyclaceae bacterium]|nr:hypothetical protein [Rhodocyclaceae bacterium]